jgi:hypothetical protein
MLDFEEFLVEYSSFETELKEENIEIFSSPDIEKCFSLDSFEYLPTSTFSTPLSVKTFSTKEVGTQPPIVKTKSLPFICSFLSYYTYSQVSFSFFFTKNPKSNGSC